METIKTWQEAVNLIDSKKILEHFAININFGNLNLNARTEKLNSHKNIIHGYLSSEHKGFFKNDTKNESEEITLPNGTEFKYVKEGDTINVIYYKRSGLKYFIGLSDTVPNNFKFECEIVNIKPSIIKDSINYIGFNTNNKDFNWLSNSSKHKINFDSFTYKDVDSVLRSLKTNPFVKLNAFPEQKNIQIYMPMPLTMRGSGSSVYDGLTKEHTNITVKEILFEKLKQHYELSKKLIETKDKILYFDISEKGKPTSSEYYWGAVLENNELLGYNNLGKIWMEIRSQQLNKN